MEEIWREVIGFEGRYYVSNKGKVKSVVNGVEKLLKGNITKKGYVRISFHIRPKPTYQMFLHRLVALAFIPNPKNYTEINHIDGNKQNNDANNLEWCTPKYNSWHKFHILGYRPSEECKAKLSSNKKGKKLSKKTREAISKGHIGLKRSAESVTKTAKAHEIKVTQYKDEVAICTYKSLTDASISSGVGMSCISACLHGRRKTAGGFIWIRA